MDHLVHMAYAGETSSDGDGIHENADDLVFRSGGEDKAFKYKAASCQVGFPTATDCSIPLFFVKEV